MKCNATLTTQTVTDETVAERDGNFWRISVRVEDWPDGWQVTRVGDRLVRVDTHTVTCERGSADHVEKGMLHHGGISLSWSDEDAGASPHVDRHGSYNEYLRAVGKTPCSHCGGTGRVGWLHTDAEPTSERGASRPCPDCGAALSDHEEGQHPGTPDTIRDLLVGGTGTRPAVANADLGRMLDAVLATHNEYCIRADNCDCYAFVERIQGAARQADQ